MSAMLAAVQAQHFTAPHVSESSSSDSWFESLFSGGNLFERIIHPFITIGLIAAMIYIAVIMLKKLAAYKVQRGRTQV
jgi:hypothetical protein